MILSIVIIALCGQAMATAYGPPPPPPTYAPPASDEYTAPPEPSQEELDKGTQVCLDAYVDCSTGVNRVGINGGAQFCQCSNGRPFLQNCPPGTVFDDALSLCNWPPTPAPEPTPAPY